MNRRKKITVQPILPKEGYVIPENGGNVKDLLNAWYSKSIYTNTDKKTIETNEGERAYYGVDHGSPGTEERGKALRDKLQETLISWENQVTQDPSKNTNESKHKLRDTPDLEGTITYKTHGTFAYSNSDYTKAIKQERISRIQKQIKTALIDSNSYDNFLINNGFKPNQAPGFDEVSSIEIENEQLVINTFPKEEDDIKSEDE